MRALLLVLLVGCGGTTIQPTTNTATPMPEVRASITAAPVRARVASDAMLAAWPIASPEMLFYVDLENAMAPDALVTRLATSIGGLASQATPVAQVSCIRDALLASKELVLGVRRGMLLVARFDRAHAPQLRACFGASVDAATVRGADDAWMFERDVVATSRDLLFWGKEAFVEEAIERRGVGAEALRTFGLEHDQIARFHLSDAGLTTEATLSATPARLLGNVDMEARTAENATDFADGANNLASQIPPTPGAADHDALVRLAKAIHATHDHKHLNITFALEEPVADQARDLVAALALAKRGVDDYLIATKTAEALNNVGQIAKDIVMAWEAEEITPSGTIKNRNKKKLTSFPAVPATVPRGVKVQTKADDWKAWAPIKFEIDQPQYYQYEVRAAKDGESATVIARGDLNGDGKTSLYELAIKVDRAHGNVLVVAPKPVETNPTE